MCPSTEPVHAPDPSPRTPPLSQFFASRAFRGNGWGRDVLIQVDDGGYITSVEEGAAPGSATVLDGVVVPGIPNVHSHAFQRGMAGLAERGDGRVDTFWSWRDAMYRFLRALGPEDVEAIATHLYVEMVAAGYTSVVEFHYLHNAPDGSPYDDRAELSLRLHRAAERAGIGLTLLPVLYVSGGFGGIPPAGSQRRFLSTTDECLDLVARLRGELGDDPSRRVGLGLHSLRAVPPEDLSRAVEGLAGIDPGAPVHIHAAEQTREVEECLAWSGARPVEWLLARAPVSPNWCIVHATHVTEAEQEGLAGTGAVVALCPTTEANLGDGLFPLPTFLDAGGAFGIGSDSHVSVSPVEELRWLEYGQRLASHRRNVVLGIEAGSAGRVLVGGALSGGSRATGRPVGRIAVGCRGDLVVLDHPDFAGRSGDGLLDAWVFSGNVPAVQDVIVGGRRVVREGRHELEEEARRRFAEVVGRLAAGL